MSDDWIVEALDRKPVRVDDDAVAENLAGEFSLRLEALLAAHMLEATPEGWRALALALVLQHEPAFAIETPADRSSLGGAPVTTRNFITRSMMKQEVRAQEAAGPVRGARKRAAAIVAAKLGIAPGTANNSLSRKSPAPDEWKTAPYRHKAEEALLLAAKALSSQR